MKFELKDLIRIYNAKDIEGLNFVEEIYNGVKYKLFYKSSQLHYQISQNVLSKESEIVVRHLIDVIIKNTTKDHFTIYEDDWKKPYAARFEI